MSYIFTLRTLRNPVNDTSALDIKANFGHISGWTIGCRAYFILTKICGLQECNSYFTWPGHSLGIPPHPYLQGWPRNLVPSAYVSEGLAPQVCVSCLALCVCTSCGLRWKAYRNCSWGLYNLAFGESVFSTLLSCGHVLPYPSWMVMIFSL